MVGDNYLGRFDASAVKATASFDLPLIRTLGKAFYWQRLIDTGEVAHASELARSLKLEVGWVCEVLRMTRLSPDIIRATSDGRQPRHLNLHAIRGRQEVVPLHGNVQRNQTLILHHQDQRAVHKGIASAAGSSALKTTENSVPLPGCD